MIPLGVGEALRRGAETGGAGGQDVEKCGAIWRLQLMSWREFSTADIAPLYSTSLIHHLCPVVSMDSSFVAREQDRMLRELTEFLRIPSVSTYPDRAGDCRRAAEWLCYATCSTWVQQGGA